MRVFIEVLAVWGIKREWSVAEYFNGFLYLPRSECGLREEAFEEILWDDPVFSTDPGIYKVTINGEKTVAQYDGGWWHTTEALGQFRDCDIQEIGERIIL